MVSSDAWLVQETGRPSYWQPCGPRAAAHWLLHDRPVRLVSRLERALQFARAELSIPPWVIQQGLRKAGGSQGRALVCHCLTRDGMTERQVAGLLDVAQSSVHDLMKAYAKDKDVVKALKHWPVIPAQPLETSP